MKNKWLNKIQELDNELVPKNPISKEMMMMNENELNDMEFEISTEIEELLSKISKNREYGEKNNCLSDFTETEGKYYKKFNSLIRETFSKSCEYIAMYIAVALPMQKRLMETMDIRAEIISIISSFSDDIWECCEIPNKDGLKKIAYYSTLAFSMKYAKYYMSTWLSEAHKIHQGSLILKGGDLSF